MRNKYTLFSLLLLLFAFVFGQTNTEAASANVTAMLIQPSNNGNKVDPQLQRYASHLKRISNASSLKLIGRSSARSDLPGNASVSLGQGHSVRFEMKDAGGGKLYIRATWFKGGQRQSEIITHNARRGTPSVTGAGGLVLLVIAN